MKFRQEIYMHILIEIRKTRYAVKPRIYRESDSQQGIIILIVLRDKMYLLLKQLLSPRQTMFQWKAFIFLMCTVVL